MKNEWFKDWFASEDYLKVYNHRDSKDAQNLSDLIINTINPQPKDFILDAACGTARHGLYLASKGYRVFGFDLSRTLLLKAYYEAKRNGIAPELIQADIRQVQFKQRFFAVLNLFTSFGYFETDEENFLFVKHATGFLKENGYYILDYFNKNYLEMNLIPESKRTVENTDITETRKIENGRVLKKIKLVRGNESNVFFESVQLYDSEYIVDKFAKYGFKVFRIYGDYYGSEFDNTRSPRLIIVFQL